MNKIAHKNEIVTKNVDETIEFAKNLAKKSKINDVFCLEGDLGVGKTVIAKGICKFFNVDIEVTSPTFTLFKSYDVLNNKIKSILHFDLYRIKNIDELINIGFEDYIYTDDSILIIEWPEYAYKILNSYKKIIIKKLDNYDYNCRLIRYEKCK